MASVHNSINIKAVIEDWAKFTIKDWQKAISKRGIGNSGRLHSGLQYKLFFRGDQLIKIQFVFPLYGRFVDMGVGKGVKIGDVSDLKEARRLEGKNNVNRRKPKKWLNSPLHYNHNRLAELLPGVYGKKITASIIEVIEG